ncbi:hypothetical protein PHYSODRAFT_306311 [Phytophthora sojae]|uniref:RxLR effector protein n=1 Tax=Phytophthora sojae (strain P6497) TaxID=1094619 RepID=G5A911_PHYSP|nr:hypothetical protein PHYSODRAFT_306311 [Phytophthora sojae]EGZ08387.1 hypothetical protein PHYSODRAFT_306311 [Phytophthora sojae]|eukprot:XP_009536559.1 hypothetical protein PHYSODRAFT_306311 [Phytophthora sojae]
MQLVRFLLLLMATLIAASNATQVGRGTTHPNHDDEASNFHGDAIEERSAFSFTSKLKGFFNKKTGLGNKLSNKLGNLREDPNVVAAMNLPGVKKTGVALEKDPDLLANPNFMKKLSTILILRRRRLSWRNLALRSLKVTSLRLSAKILPKRKGCGPS